MSYAKEKSEFLEIMFRESDIPLEELRRIMRATATIQRYMVDYCGRTLTHAEWRTVDRCERRLRAICEPYGVGVHFQQDPRGACIKLQVPGGYTNDWGAVGICVPTPHTS